MTSLQAAVSRRSGHADRQDATWVEPGAARSAKRGKALSQLTAIVVMTVVVVNHSSLVDHEVTVMLDGVS
jgi:hypothetical protein